MRSAALFLPTGIVAGRNGAKHSASHADLDHLVFLRSGNTALTRRATKYSRLHAVVVRFSQSRKRNERQGVLVEESALEQAERECQGDAAARKLARERTERNVGRNAMTAYVTFDKRVGESFPGHPGVP